jgi:hypothetical protein
MARLSIVTSTREFSGHSSVWLLTISYQAKATNEKDVRLFFAHEDIIAISITISHLVCVCWEKTDMKGVAMTYVSVAIVKPSASRARLHALVTELKSLDCLVKLDQKRWLLEFQVPDTMLCWLRTGGLSSVFASYADVVHWTRPFRETSKTEVKALPVSSARHQSDVLRS